MKKEEIVEFSFKKKELPVTCNLAEKYFYLQLYHLYEDYRKGLIDKEKAEKEKTKFEKEFDDNQRRVDNYYEVFRKQTEIRKKYNDYMVAIEKSQTQDEILDNSLKFIENLIQDNSFYGRQMKKIDNENKI